MKHIDLSILNQYIGVDIVYELILKNIQQYTTKNVNFAVKNIVSDPLPYADLILCRDCMNHLLFLDIFNVLINFKNSNSKYLLLTTYPSIEYNSDLTEAGKWRALNFTKNPFNFPKPLLLMDENHQKKHIGLWKISDLPI